MTEILRYSQIGKQDLKIGTGQFEVRLGDGTVIVLDEIRLTDFLSTLTPGSVLFVKAGGIVGEDNANFFWDDTNNRLGIGTASPSQPLHVVGIIYGTGNLQSDANILFKSGTSFIGTLDHAITAARTWTLPDRAGTMFLPSFARLRISANQSITNAGDSPILWDTEDFDTDAFHSTVTNTERFTMPFAGKFLFSCQVGFAANATGIRRVYLRKNGATSLAFSHVDALSDGVTNTTVSVSDIESLSSGDYVEAIVYQNSGGALNVVSTAVYTFFFVTYLGE